MKHIVCYSGGHSSALVALNVVHRFGKENVILLNHDINSSVESEDIKRFKQEISEFLDVPITYANYEFFESKDQFDVSIDNNAFKHGHMNYCTNILKTRPFMNWLNENFQDKDCIIYYGFDSNEIVRIQRRSTIMSASDYKTDYPLAFWWDLKYTNTKQIGINPPNTYNDFKHANCTGCLKAGKQHWYIVYCTRTDIWNKAKFAEDVIGYSILKSSFLIDLEGEFEKMKELGIVTTEHEHANTFFTRVKKLLNKSIDCDSDHLPCECLF